MKKLYVAPQCKAELIDDADILTLSPASLANSGEFFDFNDFIGEA